MNGYLLNQTTGLSGIFGFKYLRRGNMKYKVHRIDVNSKNIQEKTEQFINNLDGEVISVIPNICPTFQLMGATAKIDFLLIIEKIK